MCLDTGLLLFQLRNTNTTNWGSGKRARLFHHFAVYIPACRTDPSRAVGYLPITDKVSYDADVIKADVLSRLSRRETLLIQWQDCHSMRECQMLSEEYWSWVESNTYERKAPRTNIESNGRSIFISVDGRRMQVIPDRHIMAGLQSRSMIILK